MKVLLVGGRSTLAQVLRPVLESFAEVVTAGRAGCDVAFDLTWPAERFKIPPSVDVVINLAAHFGGPSFADMLAAEEVNVMGALKVAHACVRARVAHLIHISSISACLAKGSPYFGIYALSKRHADEVIQQYCANEGLLCAILRPSQLYGDQDGFRKHQPFLYTSLDRVMCGEDIVIYGNRGALRNYVHAEDVCRVIAAVIKQKIEGIYQCTSHKDFGLDVVAETLIAASGSPGRVIFDGTRDDIPDNIFPYEDTLYRAVGVHPEIGIEAGIGRLVATRLTAI